MGARGARDRGYRVRDRVQHSSTSSGEPPTKSSVQREDALRDFALSGSSTRRPSVARPHCLGCQWKTQQSTSHASSAGKFSTYSNDKKLGVSFTASFRGFRRRVVNAEVPHHRARFNRSVSAPKLRGQSSSGWVSNLRGCSQTLSGALAVAVE